MKDTLYDGIPDLDTMSIPDLLAFARRYRNPPLFASRRLIGDTRPRYTHIVRQIAKYAEAMALCKAKRDAGNLIAAAAYLQQCERIRRALPADLKWD